MNVPVQILLRDQPLPEGAKPAVCMVVRQKDHRDEYRYLAVYPKKRGYRATLPGGVVDPGENPEAAAARELYEETGYFTALEHSGFLVVHTGTDGATYGAHVFFFEYDALSNLPEPRSENEKKERARWAWQEELEAGPYTDVYSSVFFALMELAFADLPIDAITIETVTKAHEEAKSLREARSAKALVDAYFEGKSIAEMRAEHPEAAIPDAPYNSNLATMQQRVITLQANEELNLNEIKALKQRVEEFEGGEEVKRLFGLWKDETESGARVRNFLTEIFAMAAKSYTLSSLDTLTVDFSTSGWLHAMKHYGDHVRDYLGELQGLDSLEEVKRLYAKFQKEREEAERQRNLNVADSLI